MPLDVPKRKQPPSKPTDKEVDAQVEKLCRHPLLQGEKRGDLLRYLVRVQREGRYEGLFTAARPRPTGKRVVFEFYVEWAKRNGERMPEHPMDTELAGKNLTGELRNALVTYYVTVRDPVVIAIQSGRSAGYAPLIKRNMVAAADRALKPGSITRMQSGQGDAGNHALADPVECHHLGNDREAMRYVLERYRSEPPHSPRLIGLRDTHVRAEVPMRFRHDYYKELGAAFGAFLKSGDPEGSTHDPDFTKCTLIFGWEVDKAYVRMVQSAATGVGDILKCYRLKSPGPLMNFILMDYEDLTTEVLFGWGQDKPSWPGAVFRSKDHRLVEEFNNFYEVLLDASDPVPVKSLLENPVRSKPQRTPLERP